MSDDENATVVLDIAKMKEELEKKNDLSTAAQDLEFTVGGDEEELAEAPTSAAQSESFDFNVILFEYGKPYFEEAKSTFPSKFNYIISKDVKDLSARLKSPDFQIVCFYYSGDPKAVNTLSAQIKSKFPKTKTIIIAKNLAPEKAKAHQATASGANGYLSIPFDQGQMEEEIKKIYKESN